MKKYLRKEGTWARNVKKCVVCRLENSRVYRETVKQGLDAISLVYYIKYYSWVPWLFYELDTET